MIKHGRFNDSRLRHDVWPERLSEMAACATETMAIGDAYEVIRAGRAKCMLAGGTESLRSAFSLSSIDVLNALSRETVDPNKASCPFSMDRSGFILDEGSAVVCLEDYDSAIARAVLQFFRK